MSSRRRSRQIEIFNFSFLDILACTIGLLIFIMIMIFVLQSGGNSLQTNAAAEAHFTNQIASLQLRAADDERIAVQLEEQQMKAIGAAPDTLIAWNKARTLRDATLQQRIELESDVMQLKASIQSKEVDKTKLDRLLVNAEARYAQASKDTATAQAAFSAASTRVDEHHVLVHQIKVPGANADFYVIHVDCRLNEVAIMELPMNGKAKLLGRTPANQLNNAQSSYQQILNQHRNNEKVVVVFWVRPDSHDTFQEAKASVPSGMNCGYEPASDDWKFLEEGN
jgi:hypothetical protein